MGKVKKSVQKFIQKGGKEAPQKANKKRKQEAQERDKIKKKLSGNKKEETSKKTREVISQSIEALEEMDVSAFMKDVGSDSEEEEEVGSFVEEGSEDDDDEEEEDNEDDEDEDDEDDDELGAMKKSMSSHKQELEQLAEKDPEFFKYLQANNQDLLDFEGSDDEDDEGDESGKNDVEDDDSDGESDGGELEGADEEEEADVIQSKTTKKVTKLVTLSDLKTLISNLDKEHSLRGLKKLLDMYRAGCSMGSEGTSTNAQSQMSKYSIPSASVFNHLIVSAIQCVHVEFTHHGFENNNTQGNSTSSNNVEDGTDMKKKSVTKSPHWSKLEPLILAFFKATLSLLRSVTDMSLGGFILKQLKHYTIFMQPFPTVIKKFLKLYLDLWGESQQPDAESRSVQVAAFFRIRQLAIMIPFPLIEDCLKGLYLTYVRNAHFTNEQSIPVLTFMGNCIVALFGLDMKSSFSHGFVYIRQLAMVLRNAMVKKSKESLSSVFNWQFLNSLRVWSAVVAQYPGKDELKDLIFPLVQVLMGVERLGHSPRLLPFRLHVARLLNQLSASGCVFIPVSPIMLDVLVSPELHKKPIASTDLPPKFDSIIKLPEHLSAHQQDAIFNNAMELLHQNLDIYAFNPGYPEMSVPVKTSLANFAKNTKIARWRSAVKGEIDSINKQSLWVTQKRGLLANGPGGVTNGVASFESLLPTEKPSAAKRLEAANRAKTKAEQLANQQEAAYAAKMAAKMEKNAKKQLKREAKKEAKEAASLVSSSKNRYQSNDNDDGNDDDDIIEEGFDWDDDEESE